MNGFDSERDGYRETIQRGITAVRSFRPGLTYGEGNEEERIERLRSELMQTDAVVVGAGAGLSTSAGLTYSGERFKRYFGDFEKRFGIHDMYSGGFYPFPDNETRWAWWARHIYYNRYVDAPKPIYQQLLKVVADKDYFVMTAKRLMDEEDRFIVTKLNAGRLQEKRSSRLRRKWWSG